MKEIIVQEARDVFNQKGIQKTTFRDIAKRLSVSDGHIRYYFKTKEVLLLAVFDEMDKKILALSQKSAFLTHPLQELVQGLEGSFRVMANHEFFFTESPSTLKGYPVLYNRFQTLFQKRKLLFENLFKSFIEENIFTATVTENELNFLFEQFFILSEGWIRHHRLQFSADVDEQKLQHYSRLAFHLFKPFLSDDSKAALKTW